MPQPPTVIRFNSDVPAPPEGASNLIFQSDDGLPLNNMSAFDPLMVGDTGTGGYSGNVPAPPAGSAATGAVLRADGTWGQGGSIFTLELVTVASTTGTLAFTPIFILGIFRNGLLMLPVGSSPDYTISGATFTLLLGAYATDQFYAIYTHA